MRQMRNRREHERQIQRHPHNDSPHNESIHLCKRFWHAASRFSHLWLWYCLPLDCAAMCNLFRALSPYRFPRQSHDSHTQATICAPDTFPMSLGFLALLPAFHFLI